MPDPNQKPPLDPTVVADSMPETDELNIAKINVGVDDKQTDKPSSPADSPAPALQSPPEKPLLNPAPKVDKLEADNIKPTINPPKKPKKPLSVGAKIAIVIALIILLPVAASAYPLYQLANLGKNTRQTAAELVNAAKSQDLVLASEKLNAFHQDVANLQSTYRLLGWMQYSPFRWHYLDGQRGLDAALAGVEAGQVMLDAIMPYTDVLGLKGEGTYAGGTAQERIVAILDTLDKISPSLEQVSQKLELAQQNIDQIDPARYPDTIGGYQPASLIAQAKEYLDTGIMAVGKARPVIQVLPKLAGVDQTRRYLVLFQNDAELRPTGGFMTAYAIMDMTRGTIVAERSEDIYNLDNKFNQRLAPPPPIKKYLPLVYYWYLRDMNLSPDFKDSMDLFVSYYEKLPGETKVDGIIAIDTNVLKDLVAILGPIEVPGYGEFSSEIVPACDCPQVIWKLEDMITRPVAEIRLDRKAVLGPMMQTLLQKAFDADSNVWPQLFQTMAKNVAEKHIMFYMKDEAMQSAAESINVAGRIQSFEGDYLHINNANFGGAKSNMFVTEEVEQTITLGDGAITKDLEITYKNPFPASNCNLEAGKLCLNGVLRNFMRLYVPLGSTLINSQGLEENSVQTYDELGKTVIEGFFTLQPQSQKTLRLSFETPYSPQGSYKLMIQKQPGTYTPKHTLTIGDSHYEEFDLTTDKTFEITL